MLKPKHECDPVRVVIFAARRTGSSLLVRELRRSRLVLMHGEIFHVTNPRDPDDGFAGSSMPPEEAFYSRRQEPRKLLQHIQCHSLGFGAVGFKVFHDHLRPRNWPVLTQWCTVCVLLTRDDVIAQDRSLLIARRTGLWKGRSRWPWGHLNETAAETASLTALHRYRSTWYNTVLVQALARTPPPTLVRLSYERHLRGRPNLTELLKHLPVRTNMVEQRPASTTQVNSQAS